MDIYKTSKFTADLVQCNSPALKDFKKWVFYPGMLFNSLDKWWTSGQRNTIHEGVDLCFFEDQDGMINKLNTSTVIPSIFDGVVSAVIDDYLAKTIIIEHTSLNTGSFCTVFGHVILKSGITEGSNVKQGQVIASISGTEKSKANLPPHLHISVGHVYGGISYSELDWNIMSNPERFSLEDPIDLIGDNYKIIRQSL